MVYESDQEEPLDHKAKFDQIQADMNGRGYPFETIKRLETEVQTLQLELEAARQAYLTLKKENLSS